MGHSVAGRKVALVTGALGQDGVYLSELLLAKGYTVHGASRGRSPFSQQRIRRLHDVAQGTFIVHSLDVADRAAVHSLVRAVKPAEVYNLAAQSSVPTSLDSPEETFRTNVGGVQGLIEAICSLPSQSSIRLFQASTSEIFGPLRASQVDETTTLNPTNPYGQAKKLAHEAAVYARCAHGLHASNGILFNHESPLRGEGFVTRKIARAVASIGAGRHEQLILGNLDARRDWGHAREYAEAMWLMLQQEEPDDYVLATGITASPRDFVEEAFAQIGIEIAWRGHGADEYGACARTGAVLVKVDPSFFRPEASTFPRIDTSKAKARLGWAPVTTWRELCAEMVADDISKV